MWEVGRGIYIFAELLGRDATSLGRSQIRVQNAKGLNGKFQNVEAQKLSHGARKGI